MSNKTVLLFVRHCFNFYLKFLQKIKNYDTLHSTIILLKPNEARLLPSLEYCITELLNFFPKDFASNISELKINRSLISRNNFILVFCATNARNTWYEWGDSWRAIEDLLTKLNVGDKIQLRRNFSAFALDNDGFRYALATAKGANLESFSMEAETSWKKSNAVVLDIIRRIKCMDPFTTGSILSLNESYQAVQNMCRVSHLVF